MMHCFHQFWSSPVSLFLRRGCFDFFVFFSDSRGVEKEDNDSCGVFLSWPLREMGGKAEFSYSGINARVTIVTAPRAEEKVHLFRVRHAVVVTRREKRKLSRCCSGFKALRHVSCTHSTRCFLLLVEWSDLGAQK